MKETVANFDIHRLFRFRVISSNKRAVEIFKSKFLFFYKEEMDHSDLDIFLGDYKVKKKVLSASKDSSSGDGFIDYRDYYKVVKWRIMLDNLEDKKWDLYCHSNYIVGYEALITKVIRPLFSLKLAMEGMSLIHASAIAFKDRAWVFSALPGVGKSSLSFFLSKDEKGFFSDENVLIDSKGEVFSFPLSIPYTTAMSRHLNFKIDLSLKELCEVRFGDLLLFLSRGFLERSFSLHPERCFKIQDRAPLDKLFILTKSPEDFSSREIGPGEGAEKLLQINSYEMVIIMKYLYPYFLVNPKSRLLDRESKMLNNFKAVLTGKKIFGVNLNQADFKDSLVQFEEFLSR